MTNYTPSDQPTLPGGGPVPTGGPPPTTTPIPSDVGKMFGRYRILGELGHGGMGVVWKAWDSLLQRVVALKRILGGESNDNRVQRFVREAQAAARLSHPNIVGVHDVGVEGGQHYFTTDFIEGESLEAMMQSEVPLRTALDLVRSVAEALAYAHSQGVIHRDVKPANILVDRTGRPFVMDFGLAREVDEAAGSGLTVTGDLIGTPLYMSPEQASGHARLHGPASDQFSLGVVLYQLVTGRLPFQAETLQGILNAITDLDPRRPCAVRPDLPRDVETICLKTLEKDPSRRYADLHEMAKDLRRVLDGDPIQARGSSLAGKLLRKARKNRPVVLLSAIALVALSVLPFFWTFLSRERERRAHADDALRKTALVQEVFSRWGMLSDTLRKLEGACYDSRSAPKARQAAVEVLWKDVDGFIRATPADPTSQAMMKALAGWARRLAGHEEEGIGWMRQSRRLDPDLPYGALLEALDCLSGYLLQLRARSLTVGAPSVDMFMAPGETPEMRSLRERMEALLAEAASAPIWGSEVGQDARNLLATVRAFGERRYDDAEASLSAVIGRSSMQVFERELLLGRAFVRLMRKEYAGGIEDVNRVREARPDQALLFVLLGLLHGSESVDLSARPEKQAAAFAALTKSLADFNEAIARDPGLAAARLYRGFASWGMGEAQTRMGMDPRAAYAQAIGDYTEVLKLDASHEVDVRNARAVAYLSKARATEARHGDGTKELQAAIADLDAVERTAVEPAGTYAGRGVVFVEWAMAKDRRGQDPTGEYGKGIEDFGRALERDPRLLVARRNRGVALAQWAAAEVRLGRDAGKEWEGALSDISRCIADDPGKWEDRLNRGVVLSRLGRYAEAIPEYEAAQKLSGGKADVQAPLDEARKKAGAQEPR